MNEIMPMFSGKNYLIENQLDHSQRGQQFIWTTKSSFSRFIPHTGKLSSSIIFKKGVTSKGEEDNEEKRKLWQVEEESRERRETN